MKGLSDILHEKKHEAKELMATSETRHEGLGMMQTVNCIMSWLSSKRNTKKFLNKDNTIVKDGYLYVKVSDIPFDEFA